MSSTNKVRAGVAGIGAMGKNHARIYSELESSELTAIFDLNKDLANELASQYGGKVVDSMEEFISLVDAATIATPTVTHREIGCALLYAGKHVLMEKPISDSVDDATALIDLAHEKGLVLQVGHIERFNPVMAQLESHLDNPKFIESHRLSPFPNRSMDIGVVLDLMIHDLEIILHLVDTPIAKIDATGIAVLTKREDIANARITFENNCVANITASRISPEKMRKIRVFQNDAYLSLDYQDQSGWIYRKEGLAIAREKVEVEKGEPLKSELASFIDCASQGLKPRVSGQQGADALDVALQITRIIDEANSTNQ